MMIKLRLLCVLAALSLCSVARAQTAACPWLTEGTASALLNGPVAVTTRILPAGDSTCTFTLQQGAATSVLEISIAASDHSICPSNSMKLSGIGNEAVSCTQDHPPNETTDIVSGRARNLYFAVRLTVTGKPSTSLSHAMRQSLLEQVAEQVAGNLY
jgi:hypothetical protein